MRPAARSKKQEQSRRARELVVIVAALFALATAACSSSADARVGSDGDQVTPMVLPPPTGEVVLTVTGSVGYPNVGDELQVDVEAIESIGLEKVTVFEPFIEEDLEFSGVPLQAFLGTIGIDRDTPLTWTALDDYEVHYTYGELDGQGAFLATRQNGAPIEIADGGPIRVIFTKDDGLIGRDTNQWIWSLRTVDAG